MKSFNDLCRPPIPGEMVWCPDGTMIEATLHTIWVIFNCLDKYYPVDENPKWISEIEQTCNDCSLFPKTGCPFCRAKGRMGF